MSKAGDDKPYGDTFYNAQIEGSYRSACIYVPYLIKILNPHSVADFGCGRGAWLKAFKENGIDIAVGFDGNWNSQENMIDPTIKFIPVDLNNPINLTESKFDLAVSLEVAEHLQESSARSFIKAMTMLADAVLFSAAYSHQGGTGHINEQPHTYWANLFAEFAYTPYDLLRSVFWDNEKIDFWYRQNAFIYIKEGSEINQKLQALGYQPIKNIQFMNCIHPDLYQDLVNRENKRKKKKLVNKIKYSAIGLILGVVISTLFNYL